MRVAQLEGIPGANDIEARKKGFADAIAGTNIEVVYSYACDDNVDQAIEGVEAYTRAEGDNISALVYGRRLALHRRAQAPCRRPTRGSWLIRTRKIVTVDIFVQRPLRPSSRWAYWTWRSARASIEMGYQSVMNLYKLIKGEAIDAPFRRDHRRPVHQHRCAGRDHRRTGRNVITQG